MRANRWLLVGGALLAACGGQRTQDGSAGTDAGLAKLASGPLAAAMRSQFVSTLDPKIRFQMMPPPTATGFDARAGRLVPRLDRSKTPAELVSDVELPARADGAFRVAHGSAAIEVRVLGAAPAPAASAGGDVVYDGVFPAATLVHVPNVTGTEEFVRFAERPEKRELRYEIRLEGARGLRLYDGTLEILDEGGWPQLHTRAPWIMDGKGVVRQGDLRVEGCAYDSNDSAPWGRPVTAPGADRCTVVTTWDDADLTYPILVDPAWTNAGALAQNRHAHAAAAIKTTSGTCSSAGGCVLVAGGMYSSALTVLSSAELYESGTWTTVAAMPNAREGHTLTSTDDGRAVLVGGRSGATYWTSTYTYNPNAVTKWQSLGVIPTGRAYGATVFQKWSGYAASYRYLAFTGGFNSTGTPVKTVDYYAFDATTPGWNVGPDMLTARARHVATSYTEPCIGPSCTPKWYYFVAGGQTNAESLAAVDTSSIERTPSLFGPTKIGDLSAAKKDLAVAISGGYILFAGGTVSGSTAMNHVDAVAIGAAATVTKGIATLGSARFGLEGATFVAGGQTRALFTGGSNGTGYTNVGMYDAEIFSPATSTTFDQKAALMLYKHTNHTATTLANNTVLVAGGNYGLCGVATCSIYYYANTELFAPLANGTACTSAAECASLNCVDGVCCNTSCGGQCEACNIAGSAGTCSPKTGAPAGTRPACTGYGTTCGSQCDGANRTACVYAGPTTVCSAASCDPVKNEQSAAAYCNGTGACNVAVKSSCNPYSCGPSACKTACSSNPDCAVGFKCSGTGCVPSGDKGATCTTDTDCLAPNKCVDGVCCSSSSCPSGQKCNIPGSVGDCKLPYGAACTTSTAASCPTGKCADGVCCDTVCTGQCEACNVSGSVGTCIAVSGAPRGTRTACVGTGLCQAQCDGADRTKCAAPPGVGTTCAAAFCSTNTETPTRYCDGLGACAAATSTACAPYVCGAVDCKKTCTSNTDCQTGYFCDSGSCVTTGAAGTVCTSGTQCASGKCTDGACCNVDACPTGQVCNANGLGTCSKALGQACTTSTECGSGKCVDGVCCNTACDKQCEACDVGGSVGTCLAVAGKPHGSRTACAGTGSCQASCDGADRTKCGAPPGTSTTCGTPSCAAGIATPPAYCDGAGNCGTAVKKACAPYVCDATDCKTTCTVEADCAAGYTCKDNACAPKAGVACATAADCKSGYCVDGVCCDGACTGQCEACDVAGSEGKCSPITGAPHGSRTACFDGGGDACKALSCDGGKDRLKCVAFKAGPESTCGPTKCVDATTELEAPRCDGSGSCKAGSSTRSCSPYACDSSAGSCKSSCAVQSDCASGFVCNAGKCEPAPNAKCSDDGTTSVPTDASKSAKPCTPYKCNVSTGDCYGNCTSSDQCAAGNVCDTGACLPAPSGDTGDSGGCIASPGRVSSGGAFVGMLMMAVGVVARRRRRA